MGYLSEDFNRTDPQSPIPTTKTAILSFAFRLMALMRSSRLGIGMLRVWVSGARCLALGQDWFFFVGGGHDSKLDLTANK